MSRRAQLRAAAQQKAVPLDVPPFEPREPRGRGNGWPPWDSCWTPSQVHTDAILYTVRHLHAHGPNGTARRLADEWIASNPDRIRQSPPEPTEREIFGY